MLSTSKDSIKEMDKEGLTTTKVKQANSILHPQQEAFDQEADAFVECSSTTPKVVWFNDMVQNLHVPCRTEASPVKKSILDWLNGISGCEKGGEGTSSDVVIEEDVEEDLEEETESVADVLADFFSVPNIGEEVENSGGIQGNDREKHKRQNSEKKEKCQETSSNKIGGKTDTYESIRGK